MIPRKVASRFYNEVRADPNPGVHASGRIDGLELRRSALGRGWGDAGWNSRRWTGCRRSGGKGPRAGPGGKAAGRSSDPDGSSRGRELAGAAKGAGGKRVQAAQGKLAAVGRHARGNRRRAGRRASGGSRRHPEPGHGRPPDGAAAGENHCGGAGEQHGLDGPPGRADCGPAAHARRAPAEIGGRRPHG